MNVNKELFNQFKRFAIPHKESWDIDPVYPILAEVQKRRYSNDDNGKEKSIWHTLLYVTWYHLGSAEKVLNMYPEPCVIDANGFPVLPTGTERRGFRGQSGTEKAIEMLNYFGNVSKSRGLVNWMNSYVGNGGVEGWNSLYYAFTTVKYNGSWAGYKWCDLSKNVLHYKITASDIGLGGGGKNAGPVPGMVQLTGESWEKCAKDFDLQRGLYDYCLQEGIPFDGLEELETALCDFNSVIHKRYYIGHDIDKQQEDFIEMKVPKLYWEARKVVFPNNRLGELNDWVGVRNELKGTIE